MLASADDANRIGASEGGSVDSVAVFRRALEKAPTDAKLLGNLASSLLALGDLDGAEHVALRAIAVAGKSVNLRGGAAVLGYPVNANARNTASVWNTIAAVRLERRDPEGALAVIEHALEIDPDLGIVRFNLGRALAALGRPQEACRAWREAIELPLPAASRADAEGFLATHCGMP